MAETCPGCGVAVVPGYMRCPKCQRPLKKRITTVAGGTAVEGSPLPILPIAAGGAVALIIILFFALRGGDSKSKKPDDTPGSGSEEVTTDDNPTAVSGLTPSEPDRDSRRPTVDPESTARDLERTLKAQRLWATVEVSGSRVEVRSGSCRDANMIPAVESARTALRSAGLTQVRCVENSGAVVFEREL